MAKVFFIRSGEFRKFTIDFKVCLGTIIFISQEKKQLKIMIEIHWQLGNAWNIPQKGRTISNRFIVI